MQSLAYEPTLTPTATVPASNTTRWVGRALSAVAVLFLVFDATVKVLNLPPVVEASVLLGIPIGLAPSIGILLLACLAVYLLPRTGVLGSILLTGYLGGAIALQVRIEAAPFSLVFPLLIGVLLWGGLYLRDPHLRALIPLRR